MWNGSNDFALNRLNDLRIEIPSWSFANTGTRFGKYLQAGAATTLAEKFADAAQVHALTGITPTLACMCSGTFPMARKASLN